MPDINPQSSAVEQRKIQSDWRVVYQAATRLANRGCQFLPPCADRDANCVCIRIAKFSLGLEPGQLNVTQLYDALSFG